MAKLIIVAIRDRAVDAFFRPVFAPTIGVAVRSFQDEINRQDPNNELAKHPEDYDLYQLGTFDEETGRFYQEEGHPKQLAIGKNMITRATIQVIDQAFHRGE